MPTSESSKTANATKTADEIVVLIKMEIFGSVSDKR